MAKNSAEKIKQDKNKLIKELTKNARQSTNELSDKLDFSRQKIWRMIKEIEENGDIWGYSAVVENYGENQNIYFALIKQNIPYLSNIDEVIKNVKADNSEKIGIKLIGLFYTNGPYDGICMFAAKDIRDAKKYLGYITKQYKDYIIQIELIESVFPLIKCGIINPNIDELKKYAIEE